jgi:hypothetical protein
MKKKVLCLACSVVMGLSMTTTAFAKVGSGDVDGSGTLTASDSAAILQYTLDHTFTGTTDAPFDVSEANYDGSLMDDGQDQITANDCTGVLDAVLYGDSDIAMTVTVGKENPVIFTEFINENLTKTNMIDFVDAILVSGKYDSEITANASKVNSLVDNIKFGQTDANGVNHTTSIRTDLGWSKFESAVSGIITDKTAFDALKVGDTQYASAADIKTAYETAKQAFAPSMNASAVGTTGANVADIVGSDFITVSTLNADGAVVKSMNLTELFDTIAANNLQAYDTVTVDQLQEIFGSNVVVTVKNPNTGYENQMTVTIERR